MKRTTLLFATLLAFAGAMLTTSCGSDEPDDPQNDFANKTIKVGNISIKMIAVEGGTFTMGAAANQTDEAFSVEKPAHEVTVTSFYISETEVTQELWEAIMNENPSINKGDNLPVEAVTWDNCQTFITALNKLTGKKFRLSTEAEWEYAARGGNKSKGYKFAGSNDIDQVAWYEENCESIQKVATKKANELGIYDMSGNVYEWCQDWFGEYSANAQIDPKGPTTGDEKILRGGSALISARESRTSTRGHAVPSKKFRNVGLRLAMSK